MNGQNLHTNTWANQTHKATHEVSEPTYGDIAKTGHTKPHMNGQNIHTSSLTKPTDKATHGLSEPT
jgi:hypothetical protein